MADTLGIGPNGTHDPTIKGSRSLTLKSDESDEKPPSTGGLSPSEVQAQMDANLAARIAAGERRAAEGS